MSSSLRCPGTSATGIGNVPAVLARLESGAGRQHENADIGVLIDQLDDLFGGIAFADHPVGRDACDFFRT